MRMGKRGIAIINVRYMNIHMRKRNRMKGCLQGPFKGFISSLATTYDLFHLGIRISVIAFFLSSVTSVAEEAVEEPTAEETSSGERLLVPVPEGWEKSFHDREGRIAIANYLPVGLDQDQSDEMISAQIMFGLTGVEPAQILGRVADEAEKKCGEFDARPMAFDEGGTYTSLGILVLCGSNADTDRGELVLVRAIAGSDNFYLVQKIWKTPVYSLSTESPISLDERKKWLDYLTSINVCDLSKNTCPETAGE